MMVLYGCSIQQKQKSREYFFICVTLRSVVFYSAGGGILEMVQLNAHNNKAQKTLFRRQHLHFKKSKSKQDLHMTG